MTKPVGTPDGPLSLLVVEDNRDVAETLAVILRNSGYAVSIAFDGDQAVQMIDASPFNAIVCDIGLPSRSGYEVAEHFRARYGREPLAVAISAYGSEAVMESARDAGFDNFFTKPADPVELERVLRQHSSRTNEDTKKVPII